ncbi:hypothetical protein RJ55_04283 [Drechmeria coniospora]|nr:hypothetical protein RJ55_04283 [Drechmeria coniospora]
MDIHKTRNNNTNINRLMSMITMLWNTGCTRSSFTPRAPALVDARKVHSELVHPDSSCPHRRNAVSDADSAVPSLTARTDIRSSGNDALKSRHVASSSRQSFVPSPSSHLITASSPPSTYTSEYSMPRPSIAIVGAGPAGLCLGALLHKEGIPFTIYELRQKPTEEALSTPSGMLDLHQESGLAAIRACGLWDRFLPLTADCGEDDVIIAKDGTVVHRDDGGVTYRPEIARNSLAHLLLSATPPTAVRWAHKLLAATRTREGRIRLDFGPDGTSEHDFVVGADGAWSKVRPLLTDVKPQYGGISFNTLHILRVTENHPELTSMIGPGSCMILGDAKGLFTHRCTNDSVSLYVAVADDDERHWADQTRQLSLAELKNLLLSSPSLFASWGELNKKLIASACDGEVELSGPLAPPLKPLYMLPVGHRWEAKAGVALVGDAAHLMMPWAGEGVNLALWDALDLAAAITGAWRASSDDASFSDALTTRVADFDNRMFARTKKAAEETLSNAQLIFGENGAQALADLMASFGPRPPDAVVA